MSGIAIDKYDDRKWAFTINPNDYRANIFTRALDKLAGRVEVIQNDLIFELMSAAEYDDKIKLGGQIKFNDCIYEFIDFIIQAAIFHLALDINKDYFATMGATAPKITVDDSDVVTHVYNNVYLKWNLLSTEAQKFYDEYLMLMFQDNNGNWIHIKDPNDFGKEKDLNKVRINFKKGPDGKRTKFEVQLPDFPMNLLDNAWYTNSSGAVTQISHALLSVNFFRDLYAMIYHNNGATVAGLTINTIPTTLTAIMLNKPNYFNIRVDDMIRKRLFRIKSAKVEEHIPIEDDFFNIDAVSYDNVWKRDTDNTLMKNVNGKNERFGVNDEASKQMLKMTNSCMTSLYKSTDPAETCEKFVFDCLLNHDGSGLVKCLEKFKTLDFNETARNEVRNMNPMTAYTILSQLGFRQHGVKSVIQVENVDHWFEYVIKPKFGELEAVNLVKNNSRLLQYLNLIVQFINSNPEILNKKPLPSTTYSFSDNSWGVKPRVEPVGVARDVVDNTRFRINLNNTQRVVAFRNRINPFTSTFGTNNVRAPLSSTTFTPGFPIMQPQMSNSPYHNYRFNGGGFNYQIQPPIQNVFGQTMLGQPVIPQSAYGQYGQVGVTQTVIARPAFGLNQPVLAQPVFRRSIICGNSNCAGSKFMKQAIDNALKNAAARGKTLSPDSKAKLDQLVDKLGKIEDKLLLFLAYIEEYVGLMDVFKSYKTDTISMQKLKALFDKQNKYEIRYVSGEEKLAKLLEEFEKDKNDMSYSKLNIPN